VKDARHAAYAALLAAVVASLLGCVDPGPIGGAPDAFAPGEAAAPPSFALEAGQYDAYAPRPPPSPVNAFTDAASYADATGVLAHLADTHNVGLSCGPCHSTGCGSTPCFTLGGTVYRDYFGKQPAAGVEVRVVDLKGRSATVYSGPNGNFALYSDAGVALPAMVGARDGTTTRPMVTTLAVGMCATAGCHVVGSSPDAGAYYAIHVP